MVELGPGSGAVGVGSGAGPGPGAGMMDTHSPAGSGFLEAATGGHGRQNRGGRPNHHQQER